jgi:hypothetical protein
MHIAFISCENQRSANELPIACDQVIDVVNEVSFVAMKVVHVPVVSGSQKINASRQVVAVIAEFLLFKQYSAGGAHKRAACVDRFPHKRRALFGVPFIFNG